MTPKEPKRYNGFERDDDGAYVYYDTYCHDIGELEVRHEAICRVEKELEEAKGLLTEVMATQALTLHYPHNYWHSIVHAISEFLTKENKSEAIPVTTTPTTLSLLQVNVEG